MSYPRLTLASGVSFFDVGRIVLGGVELSTEDDYSVAKVLIDRGLAHPLPAASLPKINTTEVEIVIPTRGRVAQVARRPALSELLQRVES